MLSYLRGLLLLHSARVPYCFRLLAVALSAAFFPTIAATENDPPLFADPFIFPDTEILEFPQEYGVGGSLQDALEFL